MITFRRSLTLIAVLAAGAACSKPKPVAPPPAAVPAPRVNQDSIDAANRARAAAAAEAERQRLAAAVAAATSAGAQRLEAARAEARRKLAAVVYFDYDMDEIRDDQRGTLDAKVAIINANPDLRIRIAGHTDDRGSDEYNLVLGQGRAASVRRYLAARGVAEARFDVVSFGEQRPAQQGESEGAWSMNRRAEFEVTAGGNPLRVP